MSPKWGTVEAPVCSELLWSSLGQDKGLVGWWHWIAPQAAVWVECVPQVGIRNIPT